MVTDEKTKQLDIKDHKLNFTFFPLSTKLRESFQSCLSVIMFMGGGEGTHVTISNEALDVTV